MFANWFSNFEEWVESVLYCDNAMRMSFLNHS